MFGFTIFNSKTQIQLDASDVLRDYIMLIFCNLFVICVGLFYKKITISIGIIFIAFYFAYVAIVII